MKKEIVNFIKVTGIQKALSKYNLKRCKLPPEMNSNYVQVVDSEGKTVCYVSELETGETLITESFEEAIDVETYLRPLDLLFS